MSAELDRTESGTQGVRRILRKQISKTLDALDKPTLSDETVHTARKQLKKARATLRLLREALGEATYKRENPILRDCAHPLSAVRDGRVLIDTMDKLAERYGPPARAIHADAFRRTLRQERAEMRKRVLKRRAALKPQRDALAKLHKRAARWRVGDDNWNALGAGLKRVYGAGRKAFATAQADRSIENLHDWRKQAKYLWHQLQILEPLWPGPIGELADQAHTLTEYLGDDHDLFVLREKATEHRNSFKDPAGHSVLLALIDRCRRQLQDKAIVLGGRLYEEKPAAFEKRFGKYWRTWQRESGGL